MQSSLEVTYEITIKVLDFESVLYQLPQDFSSNVLKYSPAAALIYRNITSQFWRAIYSDQLRLF